MKNSTQRTSCVHNSKKSGSLSGIMQLSMAILFAFSITTQAEAIEYPSAKVQTAINQQSKIKITGTVVDQAGIPIIGANITVKNQTGTGTITDIDGRFTFEVPANSTLSISYIGYKNQEIRITSSKPLTIKLQDDAEVLDEVVVTALGIKREEKALGYAVQKVSGDQLTTIKSVDVTSGLNGKIAGLKVENSTEFNEAPNLKLRGENPLIVIDGVPYKNMSLRDIASDDIESIDVLKGATASALYGARGGSGAVMITTKRGKEEGLQVTVNSSTMFNAGYLKLPEVQTSYSSGKNGIYNDNSSYVWGAKLDVGNEAMQYNPYTQEREMTELTSRGKNNLKNFQELSFITNNNVSVTQKGKYGSIRTSLTHVYNKGQWPNEKLNKITYTVSGDMKYKKFSSEAGITYNKRFYPNMGGSAYHGTGYIYNLLVWSGSEYDIRDYKNYWRIKDEQSNWWDRGGWYDNPYYIANELTSSDNYDVVNAFVNASYDITSWLKLSLRSGADMYTEKSETKAPVGSVTGKGEKKGYYSVYQKRGFSTNNDIMLTAEHKFGDISVDGFVGGNIYYYQNDYLGSNTAGGLIIPGYYSLKASVDPAETSKTYNSKQTNSIYGKIGLAYKSAVFVEATGRNDWSSTLPEETRSYFYPAVSGSIIMSQLLKMPEWLNFWKLRGAWTVTKSDLGIYDTNQAYSVSTNVWDGMNTAVYPEMIRSTTLEPTAARSYEIGTAFNVWNNRLRFDISYYNKLKYNLTREATISGSSGFTKTLVNYDEEQVRRGVEVSLTASLIQSKDWNWEVNANWARDRYFYAKVDPVYSTQKPWVAAGKRWDWYGIYDWERDPQGNIIHENGYPVQSKYQSVMGNEYPDWIWGLSTTLRYKEWTLGISLDGRVGGMAYSRTEQTMWNTGVHPDSDNKWRYDEVVNGKKNYVGQGVKVVSGKVEYDTTGKIISDTRVFAPNDTQVSYESYIKNYNPWSGGKVYQNVHDCTFLKLRELSLLYTMPKSVCDKLHMKGVTLGLIGQNLLIWMKEVKYADPDVDSDDLNSPSMRYVGFNVKFDL